jgi:tetratricopeptide (TPR) repeat protein
MLSLPLPPTFQGESLVPLMKGSQKGTDDLPAYAETDYPHRAFGWSALRSLRTGKYLFVHAPKRELYDQSKDKNADHNLAASSPAVASTLQALIDDLHDKTTSYHEKPSQAPLTSEQAENLSALGYVSSSAAGASQDRFQGADPKDKIGISNILQDGMIAVEDGRYEDAIPLLTHVLEDSPLVTAAQLQLGIALSKVKRYAEAIGALRKAVEQLPDSVQAQYELGLALYETGAWRDSVPYFEFVAKKRPKWPDAQYSLASVYARTEHVPEAVELLQAVLQLNPQHFRANLLLGRILTLQHRAGEALPYLRQAVTSEPENFEPHAFLADALDELGDEQSANTERRQAEALRPRARP